MSELLHYLNEQVGTVLRTRFSLASLEDSILHPHGLSLKKNKNVPIRNRYSVTFTFWHCAQTHALLL